MPDPDQRQTASDACIWTLESRADLILAAARALHANGQETAETIFHGRASTLTPAFKGQLRLRRQPSPSTVICDSPELRQCMVFDTFGVRLNAEVARSMPGLGDLPWYQTHAAVLRANHYGPLAGFTDPEVLAGYLKQGSNTVFAALAARRRA